MNTFPSAPPAEEDAGVIVNNNNNNGIIQGNSGVYQITDHSTLNYQSFNSNNNNNNNFGNNNYSNEDDVNMPLELRNRLPPVVSNETLHNLRIFINPSLSIAVPVVPQAFIPPSLPSSQIYIFKFGSEAEANARLTSTVTNNFNQILLTSKMAGPIETFYDVNHQPIIALFYYRRASNPQIRRRRFGFSVYLNNRSFVYTVFFPRRNFMTVYIRDSNNESLYRCAKAEYNETKNIISLVGESNASWMTIRSGNGFDEVVEITPVCEIVDPLLLIVLAKGLLSMETMKIRYSRGFAPRPRNPGCEIQ